ncbi:aldo/keto reductase [Thermophagus xiamenensis]|uniref:Alcohol dehydrogenase (NADP+) n=1 Tax=Thermophagus xiamenensis TaxID=385682 RepID=A0A1I1X3N7_9BACT|nr:aldo/keto reductase [Thermophagus xiamenensis]SFE01977.1 alcohol dehydrogenase (NADP+) [Thermophagus xiamenensis]
MSENFEPINPELVPKKKLRSGDEIPAIGLGTFGSDFYSKEEIAEAVKDAIRLGYRHIDCAEVYMNEKEIGQAIAEVIKEGTVKREDLWITGKVWNNHHREVEKACRKSLEDLGIGYFDLYLVHWPFPNHHAPGAPPDARNPDSKPFSVDEFMDTWKQMEALVEKGLTKNIGTSNMTIAKFEATLPHMRILPAANEMELHPCFQQPELFNYVVEKGMQPIGYSPIGSPKRPERDRTDQDAVDIEHPIVVKIAERLSVHPAIVCIKWAIQRGQIPIPFSVHRSKYYSNLANAIKDPLTEEEMEEMKKVDCNSRLIKGQVFLWEGARGWEDLWDLDGKIAQ